MNPLLYEVLTVSTLTPLLLWLITTVYFGAMPGKSAGDRWLARFLLLATISSGLSILGILLPDNGAIWVRILDFDPLLRPGILGCWLMFAYLYPTPLPVSGAEKRGLLLGLALFMLMGVSMYGAGFLPHWPSPNWQKPLFGAWAVSIGWSSIVFWRRTAVPSSNIMHQSASRALGILSLIPLLSNLLHVLPLFAAQFTPFGNPLSLVFLLGLILIRLNHSRKEQLDVAHQLNLERALQQSERRFYRTFDATPVAMGIIQANDGRFHIVNNAFLTMTGFTRQEILGKTAQELQLWADPMPLAPATENSAANDRPPNREVGFRRKSGDIGIGIVSEELVEQDNQQFFITAVHDITQRKKVEESLARRAHEITSLYLTAVELTESLNVQAILPIIVSRAARLLNLEMGLLYLLHDDQQTLEIATVYNQPDNVVGSTLTVSAGGVAGEIVQNGQSIILDEPTTLANCIIPFSTKEIHRLIGVPLRQHEKTIGVLILFDQQHLPLHESDQQLLELFAAFAALALEKARSFARERQRTAQLAALNRVSRDLTALQDLDLLLEHITRRAMELLKRPSGGISLYRADRNVLEWTVEVGDKLAHIGMTMAYGEGMNGRVWATRQPVIINDYASWPGKSAQRTSFSAAVVGVPIQWGEKFLGVLAVAGSTNQPFTPEDAELLSQFAVQAAIAIENSRLYRHAQLEIAERARVEAALRKSEDRYRTIVDSINDALFIHDVKTGDIVDVNHRACELYGYTREEMQTLHASDLDGAARPYDQEALAAHFRETAVSGPRTFAWRTKTRTGHLFWVEANVRLAQIGDREYFLVTLRDIDDRKRAEAALKEYSERLEEMVSDRTAELITQTQELARQATALTQAKEAAEAAREEAEQEREKAELANRAKSIFLANMSHELRTPLNGILGYAQILARSEPLTPQQREGLEVIRDSGQHLLTLINDILDLSKIEASRMELYPTAVFLPQFLDEIVGIMHMRAQQKQVQFLYTPPPNLPHRINADEKRLRQVLINLLDNGVKFTDAGNVTLSVTVLTPCNHDDDPFVNLRFTISDTGTGISPEDFKLIFEPFSQAGDFQRRAEGTGLGLPISRKLLQMMGSQLHIRSKPGAGATFWFDLKTACLPPAPAPPVSPAITGYEGPMRTVLVIDDNRINQQVLYMMLERAGFSVVTASSGAEGVALARQHQPDVILIDLVMPDMDGFETAVALRQLPELQQCILVAVSASAFHQDAQKSKAAGCDDFLPKPIQASDLFALLQHWLRLTWRFASVTDEKPPIVPPLEALTPPPAETMTVLLDLALRGDLRGIQREARLLQGEEVFAPFARHLLSLAQEYEEGKILALIQQHLAERP